MIQAASLYAFSCVRYKVFKTVLLINTYGPNTESAQVKFLRNCVKYSPHLKMTII